MFHCPTLTSLLIFATLFLATPAFAAPRTHDGFFFRATTGLAYASTSETVTDTSFSISGLSTMTSLSAGWSIVNNLALHLDLAAVSMVNPKVAMTSGGTTLSKDIAAEETVVNIGVGATHYIMPQNVYVGGAFHLSQLSLRTNSKVTDSGTGWGLALNAGKEMWLSDNWGIGVAGQFLFSAVPDKGTSASTLYTPALGVLLSVTYN